MARGGRQVIPRPELWVPGEPNPWLFRRDQHWRYDPEWIQAVLGRLTPGAVNAELPVTPVRPPFVNATKQSGVLAPLFVRDGELRMVLTRRDGQMRNHKGEVAFPGGRLNDGETPLQAALREANEEVSLPVHRVRVLGELEPLTTVVSAASITPIVGFVDGELPQLIANPGEVDRIFDVSLFELTHPECYREEVWTFPDGTFPVWFFEVEDDTIWGATGRMIRRLLDLVLLSDE
jgi:8-oxo-dGTP pyrophosphatase MutT (NUDIX family)